MSHGTTGGIASTTRTRVDSAAKHIMPAKIDTNLMKIYSGNPNADLQTLHHKKLDFMTEKDDLVLNVSRKLEGVDTRTFHAYPAAVSTLGKCTDAYKLILAVLYSQRSARDMQDLIRVITQPNKLSDVWHAIHEMDENDNMSVRVFKARFETETKLRNAPDAGMLLRELKSMPFYQLQGYSLGRAYASPISGDTVFSVLIGGCVTVMNGHFAMHAGQQVQWYFEFEHMHFSAVHNNSNVVGQRIMESAHMPDVIGQKRRRLEEPLRTNFVYPKAYVPNFAGDVYGDRIRIFGKCLNGAGAFEPVDIMIMTQSL
jgi:hypothetical protein